jgi:glycerate kinase
MKLVFASDSFKGTLTSKEISGLLTAAAKEILGDCETVSVTLADGGEGTLDALLDQGTGEKIPLTVSDPLVNPVTAYYGVLGGSVAVVEMAQASGLTLVPAEKRNPLYTSSYGTGEMIRAALEAGYRDITVAIGGSATNDGGMGAARAMGVRFLDRAGKPLKGYGNELGKVSEIDMSGLIKEARDAHITVMCDVKNPLCGPNGATFVYGPQKGASSEIVEELESGMLRYREIIIRTFGVDPESIPGAGAAGGMGAMLKIFMGAELKSGIETLLDLIRFDDQIKGADYIITGEGRLDGQSCEGKAVQGVGLCAKRAAIPCIALCGCLGTGYELIRDYGITRIESLGDDNISSQYAMEHAKELYYEKALKVFGDVLR